MNALANENGATPAQGDANVALAPPIVGDDDDCMPGLANIGTLSRGLDLTSDQGEAEWRRRIEVHRAICAQVGRVPLLPGFTEADLQPSKYRPWGANTPEDMSPSEMERVKRFAATLDDIASQHYGRHWFYAHPMCRACFPDEMWAAPDGRVLTESPTKDRLGRWMLIHPGKFPADAWDDVAPPMPHEDEPVDFMTDADLDDIEAPGWLIWDVLPKHSTGVLRARDQSFKSFMALSMALEIVLDGGKVLYCIGEGANQFRHRRDAWLEHNDATVDDLEGGLHYLPAVPNLFTGGDLYDRVLSKARSEAYDLIVIDTYARATAGSDINSQQDQSVVTTRVDELKRVSNGTVLLVAHSQKSDTDSSGSIEIEDARDFVFSMKRSSNTEVTFEITKQKDGVESPKPQRYVTKEVGQSIVLVPGGEGGDESIMTTKDWIVAALNVTSNLGPRTEAQIGQWINDHPNRKALGPMKRGTISSALARMVGQEVVKEGRGYALVPNIVREAS